MTHPAESSSKKSAPAEIPGGREYKTRKTKVVLSYLLNPGPLECDVSATGRFWCKPRE